MSTHSGIRCNRPPGTAGHGVHVTTNSFAVERIPNTHFYHYNAFEETFNRRRSLEIIDKLHTQYASIFNPRAAYDGRSNMFRSQPLDLSSNNSATFVVYMGGEPEEARRRRAAGLNIKITQVAQINPASILPILKGRDSPASESLIGTTMMLLNVLIRMQPIMTHPSNARSFFTKDVRDLNLGKGLELWRGYFQSVRLSIDILTVNVDITTAVMYQGGPLIDLIKAHLGTRDNINLSPGRIDPLTGRRLEHFLKNLLVYSTVPRLPQGKLPRMRPIKRIVTVGADEYEFLKQPRDGSTSGAENLTITEHFYRTHRYRVQLGKVICIGFSRDLVYPLEVLHVKEGQFYKKALPSSLAPHALKFSTQKPRDRIAAIEKSSGVLGYRESDFLRHSGMRIGSTPITVPGRLLSPPDILYGNQATDAPRNGAWNVVRRQLIEPKLVPAWAVVVFEPRLDMRAVEDFVHMLRVACQALGESCCMRFPSADPPILNANPQGDLEYVQRKMNEAGHAAVSTFARETRATHPTFILVILPDSAIDIITAVKHWGDCDGGIATQCMKSGKLPRANNQYCNNIALKINIRIGGVNWCPDRNLPAMKWFRSVPTMVVGADVSHAAPDSHRPSISGLVSSVDEFMCRYVASTRVQESRVEIIENLEDMMTNAIKKFNEYQKATGKGNIFPEHIVFYRDGVSEGQFREVAATEVKILKELLRTLPKPTQLIFIIVGKKHHIKFFPQNGPGEVDSSGNCPAGLVVDQGIVHPIVYDFYLQSHAGILGTSRSSHYSVIEDGVKLEADQLQALSYTLCHLYGRATRSVSIPAPVYYADLVCRRGKYHSQLLRDGEDTSSTITGQEPSLDAYRESFKPIHPSLENTMYWI